MEALKNGTMVADMEVVRLLGKGAFGHVYAVNAPAHDDLVALKIMNAEVSSESMQRRFQREAEVIQRLESVYVPAIYGFGKLDDDSPFILMELLQGMTLGELVAAEGGQLPWRRVITLGVQACEALEVAHSVGVLHRDLKPDNLFVVGSADEARIKILDFGVATFVSGHTDQHGSLTQTSAIVGTPHYMSPEQIRSTKVGVEADIYMLGVVLYECLTGHRPFEGEFLGDLLGSVLSGQYRSIASHAPGTPRVLANAVQRAMSLVPQMRFASALAFAEALSEGKSANSEPPPKATVSPGYVDPDKATLPAAEFVLPTAPTPSTIDPVSSTGAFVAQGQDSSRRRLGLLALGAVIFVMLTSAATYLIATRERDPAPPSVAAVPPSATPSTPATQPPADLAEPAGDESATEIPNAIPSGRSAPPLEEPSQMVQIRPPTRPTPPQAAEPEPTVEVEPDEPAPHEVETEPVAPVDGLINPFD